MKYLFTFICAMFSFLNICEANIVPIVKIDCLQYNLDLEHYEKLNEQDYYMYIETYNVNTKDICVLHIMTNREENSYTVTNSIVRTHNGFMKSYSENEKGTYSEISIIGKAIELLDKHEEELKEESKV